MFSTQQKYDDIGSKITKSKDLFTAPEFSVNMAEFFFQESATLPSG
jgi:hypothetical protein